VTDFLTLGHIAHHRKPFTVPLTIATETLGILAVKRAGKSNTAVVIAEAMYDAGIPWVAIDPKGDWWGVRSSKDGKGPGLSVVVFGGEHADVPLEATAGHMVANLIAERHLTCVLDVSGMTKADQRRFLTDFATTLYRKNRDPLHVFCEEADEYIPQRVMGETAKLVSAWEMLVKRGGFRGIGVTLVTQRSASLNKDVLTQCGTLIALRTTSPQDRKAILGWVEQNAQGAGIVASLPKLPNGQAFIWSPEWLPEDITEVQFDQRRTFDSGSTPLVGRKRAVPVTLADVDLAKIKEEMAETVERAKADDPKELRKRIKELERRLLEAPTESVEVETTVVDQGTATAIAGIKDRVAEFSEWITEQAGFLEQELQQEWAPKTRTNPRTREAPKLPQPQVREVARRDTSGDMADLGKGERAILNVLSQYPSGRSHNQLALLTGYSPRASTISALLSNLRKKELVASSGTPRLTPAGEAAAVDLNMDPLPRGQALLDYWMNHGLVGKGGRAVLDALMAAYPETLTHEEICHDTGYSPTASTVSAIMSKLRKLELVDGWAMSADFMEAIS
jgi:hypothetical protein